MQEDKKVLKKAYRCGEYVGMGAALVGFGVVFVIFGYVLESLSLLLGVRGMFWANALGWIDIIVGVGFIVYGRLVYSFLSKDVGEGD